MPCVGWGKPKPASRHLGGALMGGNTALVLIVVGTSVEDPGLRRRTPPTSMGPQARGKVDGSTVVALGRTAGQGGMSAAKARTRSRKYASLVA